MLVLGRKTEESVECRMTLAEAEEICSRCAEVKIKIKVVNLYDGRVRLGFSAPKEVRIHREEVWAEIDYQTAKGETLAEGESDPELEKITERAF